MQESRHNSAQSNQNSTVMVMFFAVFSLLIGGLAGYGGYRYGYDRASLEAQIVLAQKDKEVVEAKAAARGGGGGEGGAKKEKEPFAPSTLDAAALAGLPGMDGLEGKELEQAVYAFNNVRGACQPCNDSNRSLGQCFLDLEKLRDAKTCANIPKLAQRVTRLAGKGASPDAIRDAVDLGVWIPLDPGNAPMHGPKDAPVTIIEISDFQCPYCKKAQATMDGLDEKYGDKIRKFFINLPLKMHQQAIPAAKAALAAHAQGKFWPFHHALFAAPKMDDAEIKKIAETLELDMGRWESDRASLPIDQAVQADMQRAEKLKITSTPMFFVNGYKVKGAQPLDIFSKLIDIELNDGDLGG